MATARTAAKAPRKTRSDKGLVREVTRLKGIAKLLKSTTALLYGRPEGLDTPATVHARTADDQARSLLEGLEKLDGRMKVRFDPRKAGK